MSAPKNEAALIEAAKAHPLVVKEVPYPTVAPGKVIIQTRAVACNPIDAKLQFDNIFPMNYPNILGMDIAGEVAEVGDGITHVKKGDRVMAVANSAFTGQQEWGGYQKYVSVPALVAVPIPDTMSYEQAAVMPSCFLTAVAMFYQKGFLDLQRPSLNPQPNGKTLFVWGGSGSVGSNVIQLAKAAGYEVAVTASTKNSGYVKSLGADIVFDYNAPNAVENVVAGLKGKNVVGAIDAVSEETLQSTIQVMERVVGKSTVASVHPFTEKYSTANVEVVGVGAITYITSGDDSAPAVLGEYWPAALAASKLLAKPDPTIIGKGLESVQAGIDKLQQGGLSAQKLVVSI